MNRLAHMQGVAEYMSKNAHKYNLNPEDMYVLGLLHDVGYMQDDENHEFFGASILSRVGYMYSEAIRYHGHTPAEYMAETGNIPESIPKELLLLWEADMTVDISGSFVGYKARLSSIRSRKGDDAYAKAKEIVSFLEVLQ